MPTPREVIHLLKQGITNMGKRTLTYRLFDKGFVSNVDPVDLGDEGLTVSKNVDPNKLGKVASMPRTASATSYGTGLDAYSWIEKDDSKKELIYHYNGAIKLITDFYGTKAESTVGSKAAKVFTTKNKSVHIGCGSDGSSPTQWAGYIDYGQFGNTAPTGIQLYDAELETNEGVGAGQLSLTVSASSTNTPEETADYFQSGKYFYRYSLIYDGLQESPLSTAQAVTVSSGTSAPSITGAIEVKSYTSFNERVTGINIYRASTTDTSADAPSELYRLVRTIDVTSSTGWTVSSSDIGYSFIDTGFEGVEYETNSGMPETSTTSIVEYELATAHNSELIVGKCYASGFNDGKFMLFKSKEHRYDMFDYFNTFIRLPEIPLALASYGGRVYAFGLNTVYRIDPQNFYVEDVFNGIGIINKNSVIVTEYGMFWCDKRNLYHINGLDIKTIGLPIQDTWISLVGDVASVAFDSKYNLVLFSSGKAGTHEVISYHVLYDRFDVLTGIADETVVAVIGKEGETYWARTVADGGGLFRAFNDTTPSTFEIHTGDIVITNQNENKWFYKIEVEQSITASGAYITKYYSVDGGANWTTLGTNTSYNLSNLSAKKIRFKFVVGNAVNTGSVEMSSFTLWFREREAKL